jgi:hypothetical protein
VDAPMVATISALQVAYLLDLVMNSPQLQAVGQGTAETEVALAL